MGDVVNLKPREPMYWQCECGCTTFCLLDTGEGECAHCGKIAGCGEWNKEALEKGEIKGRTTFTTLGEEEFSKRSYAKAVLEDDLAAVILLYNSGRIRTLGDHFESDEQKDWLDRRLIDAASSLTGRPIE